MKRLIGVTVGAAIACSAAMVTAQDKVEQGAALFTSQKCVLCHSAAGKGNKKGPLDDAGKRLKSEDIRAWLTHPEEMREKTKATRTPAMKDPKLTAEQVDALVAFLLAQK
jgi:mono/diheme cytochrome c family protein